MNSADQFVLIFNDRNCSIAGIFRIGQNYESVFRIDLFVFLLFFKPYRTELLDIQDFSAIIQRWHSCIFIFTPFCLFLNTRDHHEYKKTMSAKLIEDTKAGPTKKPILDCVAVYT